MPLPGNAPRDDRHAVGVEEYAHCKDRMDVFDHFPREVRDAFNDLKSVFSIKQVENALMHFDAATVVRMLKVKDRQRTRERYAARGDAMDGFI